MVERDPKYYTSGYDGKDASNAPLYLRSLVFDSSDADFNAALIDKFNDYLKKEERFFEFRLKDKGVIDDAAVPDEILVINASHDNLPTSYETARIFKDFCREKSLDIDVEVINTYDSLIDGRVDFINALVVSQCVDKNVYNVRIAEDLESKGAVIVPGKVTAPGGVFSDKDSTYRLLSEEGRLWDTVARYKKVPVEERTVEEVVDGIFDSIDELKASTGDDTFFVKPHEGGGGLGGFRITKTGKGYIIPDISKVSGDLSDIHPTFIDFDVEDDKKLKELLWIYRLFSSDEKLRENYIKVDLPVLDKSDDEAIKILKDYLITSSGKREGKLLSLTMPEARAKERLVGAIKIFEEKFSRRYVPLVNEHIDFGLWGLRAHYRLTKGGPKVETIYHRIFQLGFMEEGLGYMGSDNISNKQTGDLEIKRLGPVNEIMLESIGGEAKLFEVLLKGAEALLLLDNLVSEEERGHVPLRVQLDLAAVSKRIGEGNADTARGLSIASRWPVFVDNAREWLEDSLEYYAWKRAMMRK